MPSGGPCAAAIELLNELKGVSWIPAYNASGVRTVEQYINELYDWVNSEVDKLSNMEDGEERQATSIMVASLHWSLEHNKRAVLAYLKHRIDHVLELRWELATSQVPEELQDLLSQPELDAAREYDELLETYMHAVGTDLCKCMQPPKSVRVAVKVKENWGELMTDSGSINLQRNTVVFMKRDEVEPLIRQGVLEHLQTSVQ